MSPRVPIGILIRRARKARNLSQAELAERAGISQAVISYYENERASPSDSTSEKLAAALGLKADDLTSVERAAGLSSDASAGLEGLSRSAFLRTLDTLPGTSAILDLPAGADGGDLAFALDQGSHAFLIVIDAQGSGPTSAALSRSAAACAFGATMRPGGGVSTPEEIVETTVRFWATLGESPRLAAICVLRFETKSRRVRQCRLGMPPPYVRDERLAQWTGVPEGPAGAHVGEQTWKPKAMAVVATDGIAQLPTTGNRPLWQAPELRTALWRAAAPARAIDILRARAKRYEAAERADDRLAVAVAPWSR